MAVELAVQMTVSQGQALTHILAAIFFAISFFFVHRSFYGMRIRADEPLATTVEAGKRVSS
jgi:K(+)-stimulated pyrophosphate-energized sodium pump